MIKRLVLTMVGAAVPGAAWALQAPPDSVTPANAPLFASHEPLQLVLRAPFETLFDNRDDDAPQQPATLSYVSGGGDSVHIDLNLELRGNNRRQKSVCSFPPIRLDLPRSRVSGTAFAGQNRLKLVTQCRESRDDYAQYVLLEYLVYRAYNQLTDMSFRVRLLEITYVDTDGDLDTMTRPAFLIEDVDHMAKRNGWEEVSVLQIPPTAVDPEMLNLVEVFQYMIGHTDWSAFMAEPDEDECCHNVKVIGELHGQIFPVPYDFDFAGIIDAGYAEVSEQLRIYDVKERVYRGLCRPRDMLESTLQKYNLHQAAIIGVFRDQEGLTDEYREQALEYLGEFFETINDPERVDREFVRTCRG